MTAGNDMSCVMTVEKIFMMHGHSFRNKLHDVQIFSHYDIVSM